MAAGVSILAAFLFFRPPAAPYHPFFLFGWLGGIFVIFLVFWIARWFLWPWRRGGWYEYEHRSAESILKERYARGEITKGQFEEMMRDLRNNA